MRENKLKMKDDKTELVSMGIKEIIWVFSWSKRSLVPPDLTRVYFSGYSILFSQPVESLAVCLDETLSMDAN